MINKLISADDLHWCEEEKRYVSLSKEEVNKIIISCTSQNIKDFDDIYKVIKWAGLVRVGNILLNNFLNDNIEIVRFDGDEPCFGEKKDEFRQND